ncbi:hypothetical protein F5146DRAFT_1207953 [Armillaria mellea]|nr:hypothetical protein F5146DRAFT_1207953 [Armillaria mellea]
MTIETPFSSSSPVPLRMGPPTKEELIVYYPAKFTWNQLKTFVNSGDLGLLKRDKKLQERYQHWATSIKLKYGSIVNYLLNFRLQWGQPDTLSLLTSALDDKSLDAPPYFTTDIPPEYISIIQNDWPYSVPSDVEHALIWTRIPIYHSDIIAESVSARIAQDGLWGFTGNDSPPPSPSTLSLCLPALSEWGVTLEKMILSTRCTEEEDALVKRAGKNVNEFVKRRWIEAEWETAWFVNPLRLQSVPGLAHIHVFARHK